MNSATNNMIIYGLNLSGAEERYVASCCGHSNEPQVPENLGNLFTS